MAAYNHGTHRTQFDGSPLANENCVPTSLANGARELTTGTLDKSGGYFRSLVARSEEQNPNTPGWSLQDAALAANRANVAFTISSGTFANVQTTVDRGYAVLLQGDSDQFGNNTCSGVFNGDHCVCIHPDEDTTAARMLLADPICGVRRWESADVIKRYAEKFAGGTTLVFGIVGGGDMGVVFNAARWSAPAGTPFYESPDGKRLGAFSSKVTLTTIGPSMTTLDSDGIDFRWFLALVATSAVTGALADKFVWVKRANLTQLPTVGEWDDSIKRLLRDPDGRFPVTPVPDPAARTEGFNDAKSQAIAIINDADAKITAIVEKP